MRFSKNDIIFLSVAVALLILLSGWLYIDFNTRLGGSGGEPVGTITFKKRNAQRKFNNQVIWEEVLQEEPLYNRDSIRTAALSEAVITLNSGTKISIEDNSLIVLNIEDDAKTVNINFVQGGIKAESGDVGSLKITAGDSVIQTKDGDLKVSSTDQGKNLNVSVDKGEAEIESNGQKNKVQENELAKVGDTGTTVAKPPFIIVGPADNTRLVANSGAEVINFQWQEDQIRSRTLDIFRDRGGRNLVSRVASAKTDVTKSLTPGTYYWRISGTDNSNKKVQSIMTRLVIYGKDKLEPIFPKDGSTFTYVSDPPLVRFAWKKLEAANAYRIQVAKDQSFQTIIFEKDAFTTLIASPFSDGTYFWRVSSINSIADAAGVGPIQSFSVGKKKTVDIPSLIQPQNDQNLPLTVASTSGIAFTWSSDLESKNNFVEIAKDPQFASVIQKLNTNESYARISLPDAGTYFWRVRSTDSGGTVSKPSSTRKFTLRANAKLAIYSPQSNQDFDVQSATRDGIGFSWENISDVGKYQITLSKSADMSSPVWREEVKSNRFRAPLNQAGKYYWNVRLVDGDGTEIAASTVYDFSVSERLAIPDAIFPIKSDQVDMTTREDITFRWENVPTADYYVFRLYGNGRRLVLEAKTKETVYRLRDMKVLDTGNFSWSVSAVKAGLEDKAPERLNQFEITLPDLKAPTILSPKEQFVE